MLDKNVLVSQKEAENAYKIKTNLIEARRIQEEMTNIENIEHRRSRTELITKSKLFIVTHLVYTSLEKDLR